MKNKKEMKTREQLDKMFDKINKDIEWELKHRTWDEEEEAYRQCVYSHGDIVGDEDWYWIMDYEAKHIHFDEEEIRISREISNFEAEEWATYEWVCGYLERCGNEEFSNIDRRAGLSTMLLMDEEDLGEYFERYKDIIKPNIIPDILLMRGKHREHLESVEEWFKDENLIKPSMITDIPKSVEEMLKN